MTTPHFWARVIRGRWFKGFSGALVLAAVVYAAAPDPLAELKAASAAVDSKQYTAAIAKLKPLEKRLPKLADYAAWLLATAQFGNGDYAAVPQSLDPVWKQIPPSPFSARAALLAARAYGQSGDPASAAEMLRKNYAALPQPEGDLALANAFAAAGDRVSAAVYDQRVYYGFPMSPEAAQAEADSAKLREQLGDSYPPAMPDAMLGRAFKLLHAGNPARARRELEALVPRLGGAERDLARVRIGVADYDAKQTRRAEEYLESLEVSSPEADAERLCYLALCARRLDNQDRVHTILLKLETSYPQSEWRLQALIADANSHLVANEIDTYEPLYRACYESFPNDPSAAMCHWKVAWAHYLHRRADAADLLREHLRMFPSSPDAPAALYFLGRLAEGTQKDGAARAYYDEIVRRYPNYYYTTLARERLKEVTGAPSPAAQEFLQAIAFPVHARTLDFTPDAASKARIERARTLTAAGLEDWAEGELRFGAQTGDQPQVLAIHLASLSSRREGPAQAIRYIKHYASGYLYLPIDSAPAEFWKLAFPMPYRSEVERFAKRNGLDPYLMAALIRQESEFDPRAVSRSNARGLIQIVPSTGRALSRHLKVRYTTARLFQPSVNLELGSYYLKSIVDSLDGRWEVALAAYNAGPSRARAWLGWGDYREPAEFIETVPFSETRNYIQTVLRNADMYRRLYGGGVQTASTELK